MQIVYIVLGFLGVWLLTISLLLLSIYRFFRLLSKGWEKESLIKVIERLILLEKGNVKDIDDIRQSILNINEENRANIQKVGLVRFNPFEELGGDHSFSLALLNGRDSGFVITGLHTRDRTRVYVKEIKIGKPRVELSKEEARALRVAQKEK